MDIDLLSKMVKELILDNDKVVLPGLGCFVAEIVPSTFSDKGYTINPPYRRLSFRPAPDEGDMLVRFYASSNSVSIEVSRRIVIDFIKELKLVLHSRKMVVFPGLGKMRATKENNLFFVADENLDIYPSGFGLHPVSMKTHNETKEELSAAVGGLASLLSEASVRKIEPEVGKSSENAAAPESADGPGSSDALESAVVSEIAVESESVAAPESPDGPEMAAAPESVTVPEMAAEPESSDVQECVAETTNLPEVCTVKADKVKIRKLLRISAAVAMALAVILLAFVAVGHLAPDLIDKILYTSEELEILHYKL